MSAAPHTEMLPCARPRWRRAALAVAVAVFAVLWVGGVASPWLGRGRGDEGPLASLFLSLAGLIVLLGARTRRGAVALGGVALFGFAVEAVGVRTGLPFGAYAYTDVLRPQLLGVPLVMAPAWMALVAYACDFAARLRLPPRLAVIFAALWTTAADLVIDPLAVRHFGYWTWARGGSYYGIPFTNFVGWFLTALLACRVAGASSRTNFWAGFVGAAIILFFAANALAHSLPLVALVGFALCAAHVYLSRSFRAGRGRAARSGGL